MLYFTVPLTLLVLVVAYSLHRYFNLQFARLEQANDVYDDLTENLATLTSTLETLSIRQDKFETRYEAITKTFVSDIRDVVKYSEEKVKATKSEAYKAITGAR